MKKFFSLVFFTALTITSFAQTVSFVLSAAPCHNDGVLNANFTGLTPPLTVSWQTYGTSGTTIIHTGVSGLTDALTGYSGGEVNVTATDATGLGATGYYAGNPPFTICPITVIAALCPALDTLSAGVCAGGTYPFTYEWYNTATTGIEGTDNPISVHPGTYGVTVTDAAGCTFGSKVSAISVFANSVAPFSDTIHSTIANCTDGTITVYPFNGGVLPFNYLWSNGATSATLTGLTAGTYNVTISDAVGCKINNSISIAQSVVISAAVSTTPATCATANGSVSAAGVGGTAPYTYVWNNGATTASQSGLTGGFYSVLITDANGCTGADAGSVGTSSPFTINTSATPSLCTSPTGNASVNVTGGTGSYAVTWYTSPAQTGNTAHSLIYGTYEFQITDGAGCTEQGTVYVPPIDMIGVSFSSTPALCTLANGTLTAYPTGGIAPYSYSWSTGATTAAITSSAAGEYSLTITDHVGCKVTIEQELPAMSPLTTGISTIEASCIFTNDGTETAVAWGGTPPYVYAWSSGGTTATISALAYGPYWLSVTDATGCTATRDYSYVGYDADTTDCYCTIAGTIYKDMNNNCVQDPGENGIPNVQIAVSGMGYTYTDANGNYSMKVPTGAYIVSESIPSLYPLSPCQLNDIPVTVTASSSCLHTVNFGNVADTIHDIHISIWDYNAPVPGHTYKQVMIVSNEGTVPEDSVQVDYNSDGQLFAPSFTPGNVFTGSANHYSVEGLSLNAGANQQVFVTYAVPANTPVNTSILFTDTASYRSPIDFWQIDNTTYNNVNAFATTAAKSASNSFEEVSPKGVGTTGIISYTDSVLEYMIHFQNTGSATAQNVIIVDTLDGNLNWQSLRPVFESAPCKVSLSQNGTKDVVTFTFTDINLPNQVNDDMRSNGMVTFTAKLNNGLASGTQIKNHSSVYFDYNAPVVTNGVLNTIGTAAPQGVATIQQSQGSFTVYPNPANKSFNALVNSANDGKATMTVADVTGKTLINKNITLEKGIQTISVDVSNFANGVYFISLNGNGNTQTQKVVIMN